MLDSELLRALKGRPFPVFISTSGRPCFRPEQGASKHKVFLTSIPKAGTYLFGELIRNLGFCDSGIHIEGQDGHHFIDYRFVSPDEAAENPHLNPVEWPLANSLAMVLPGQYAVGHLGIRTDQPQSSLDGFKIVFAYRNLRDCLVTLMLYLVRTGRRSGVLAPMIRVPNGPARTLYFLKHFGPWWQKEISLIVNMVARPDILRLKFEDIVAPGNETLRIQTVNELTQFLELEASVEDQKQILDRALETKTLTKSAKRTDIRHFWNPDVEDEFVRIGCLDLNHRLGYDERQ